MNGNSIFCRLIFNFDVNLIKSNFISEASSDFIAVFSLLLFFSVPVVFCLLRLCSVHIPFEIFVCDCSFLKFIVIIFVRACKFVHVKA
jgi:hypothetical protein